MARSKKVKNNNNKPKVTPKRNPNDKKSGRYNLYHEKVEDHLNDVTQWIGMGWSEKKIANELLVGYSTWFDYKNRFPELQEAINLGWELYAVEYDAALAERILERDGSVSPGVEVFFLKSRLKRLEESERLKINIAEKNSKTLEEGVEKGVMVESILSQLRND